jgi:hypothetical protein
MHDNHMVFVPLTFEGNAEIVLLVTVRILSHYDQTKESNKRRFSERQMQFGQ